MIPILILILIPILILILILLILVSQAAMHSIRDADVIICIGTRLGPFGTLQQYGEEYWPENAKIIQIDANPRFLGLTKSVDVAIQVTS